MGCTQSVQVCAEKAPSSKNTHSIYKFAAERKSKPVRPNPRKAAHGFDPLGIYGTPNYAAIAMPGYRDLGKEYKQVKHGQRYSSHFHRTDTNYSHTPVLFGGHALGADGCNDGGNNGGDCSLGGGDCAAGDGGCV